MGLFFPYLWKCVFFVAPTSSTRLECWIYMVLMNLQDIGQTGIKVAQCEHRVTAVQVCGLNPAGWSILWMHGLPYLWQFYASVSLQIAIFVFCYSTMWSNKKKFDVCPKETTLQRFFIISLWFANNRHGSFLPHYRWSQDIFSQQLYKCVSYEMSHEADHIHFSCLVPVRIVFCMATCCCNNRLNKMKPFLLWLFCFSHWSNGLCRLRDDKCEEIAWEVNYKVFMISSNTRCAETQCLQLHDILPLPLRQEGIHNDNRPRCIWCICGHSCTGSHFLAYAQVKVEVVGWIYHLVDQKQFGFSSYCINTNL